MCLLACGLRHPESEKWRSLERWRRSAYIACMRVIALRKLLVLLTGLAFLLGLAAQAVPAARAMALTSASTGHAVVGVDCATTSHGGGRAPTHMKQPCSRISLDCATQLGCICSPGLPAELTAIASPFAWGRLSYWPHVATVPARLSIKPNLHPPYSRVTKGSVAPACAY